MWNNPFEDERDKLERQLQAEYERPIESLFTVDILSDNHLEKDKNSFAAILTSTQLATGSEPSVRVVEITSIVELNSIWNSQERQFMYRQETLGYSFITAFTALDILLDKASINTFAVFSDQSPSGHIRHMVTIKVSHNDYQDTIC